MLGTSQNSSTTPIAVFAFKRLNLLKQTLKALQKCEGYPGGPVHVFSDAGRSDVPGELAEVAAVRHWLRRWCNRHGAHLNEAATNKGLRLSIVEGVTRLLTQYEQIIVLEDDIVVSTCFLRFLHESLDRFRHDEQVYQISGYFIPHQRRLPEAGFLAVPACWGWGTWRRAWDHYDDNAEHLFVAIQQADVKRFDLDGTYDYFDSLRQNAEGQLNTWAVRWYASIFLRDGLTLYPGVSLTRNIGFGDGGTNCSAGGLSKTFARQHLATRVPKLEGLNVKDGESLEFRAAQADFYRWQEQQWGMPNWRQRWSSRWERMCRRTLRK